MDPKSLTLVIVPYVGVGPVRFGMTRPEVRQLLGEPFNTYDYPDGSWVDIYYELEVEYAPDGACAGVFVSEPHRVEVLGYAPIGRPAHEVVAWLRREDPGLEAREDGLFSPRLGIKLGPEVDPYPEVDPSDPRPPLALGYLTAYGSPEAAAPRPEPEEGPGQDAPDAAGEPVPVEVTPLVGVGPVRFGAPPEEVRAALEAAYGARAGFSSVARRLSMGFVRHDVFLDLGLRATYIEPGGCQAVLVQRPMRPTLLGRELVGRPADEVRAWVRAQDPGAVDEPDRGTLTSYRLGLFLDDAYVSRGVLEAFIAFAPGFDP